MAAGGRGCGRWGLALLVLLAPATAAADRASLRVASKSFTESVILGEIATLLARSAGTPAEHRRGLGGTRLLWDALLANELDVYPEYTGTIVQEILPAQPGGRGGADLDQLRTVLRARGVGIIGPLGFDNSYALGMREDEAARLGIRAISDLVAHPELRFGFSNEFMNRRDGWPGLRDSYGLPHKSVRGLDHDLAYRGLAEGSLAVTDLYATDAEIRYYQLRVLADDRQHFSGYQALLLHRLDAGRRFPEALAALERLTGAIDAGTMIALNAQVKLDRKPEEAVAAAFLEQKLQLAGVDGLDEAEAADGGGMRWSAIAQHTREHLALVGVSLLAAVLLALPLGVLAARRPRLGQVVLALVGIIQTIPSLALLVFMIPLLGIGAVPATVALFLYSLLPIVRNTHSGLLDVPAPIRESAQALGLPPRAILFQIELPLATRAILAGIKSAAVINVGTATLGALVGAGGFGQPIFTGIRLDDVRLILEGAVPASLLALAVQGLFDLVERFAVPRGLRP
jgi:osmoprotectant transport system permease protein